MAAGEIWLRALAGLVALLLVPEADGQAVPSPAPTKPESDPRNKAQLTGFGIDWLAELGVALFPILFLLGCLVIRLCWGCCASIFGFGNRGRKPRKVNFRTTEVVDTSGPFDWVIEGLIGQEADDAGFCMADLLAGGDGADWVEQWDETYGAWYFWNSTTGAVLNTPSLCLSPLSAQVTRAPRVPNVPNTLPPPPRVALPPACPRTDVLGKAQRVQGADHQGAQEGGGGRLNGGCSGAAEAAGARRRGAKHHAAGASQDL